MFCFWVNRYYSLWREYWYSPVNLSILVIVSRKTVFFFSNWSQINSLPTQLRHISPYFGVLVNEKMLYNFWSRIPLGSPPSQVAAFSPNGIVFMWLGPFLIPRLAWCIAFTDQSSPMAGQLRLFFNGRMRWPREPWVCVALWMQCCGPLLVIMKELLAIWIHAV